MRFSQDPTTLSYHLVNGEPRIAALPSETGIHNQPADDERGGQNVSCETRLVSARHFAKEN
jgi:hypothetical protein